MKQPIFQRIGYLRISCCAAACAARRISVSDFGVAAPNSFQLRLRTNTVFDRFVRFRRVISSLLLLYAFNEVGDLLAGPINTARIVEVVDNEQTGLLVLPKDTEGMADAVLRLLNEPKFTQNLIINAKKKIADKYTLKHMAEATLKVYEELVTSLSILVVKLGAMGDVVLATASLKALRDKYPNARIYCLVGRNSAILLQKCPYINGVIPFDLDKRKNIGYILSIARELRKYQFDKFVDFQNNRVSHWLSFLSWPRESYGYDNGKWGWGLTDKIKNDVTAIGPVEHQFRILKMLGISYNKNVQLGLWPSEMDFEHVQNLLDSEWLGTGKNIVGISLSASEKWATKNWPVEHIARLCDLLAAENIRVVLTGENKDKALVRQLISLTKSKPVNFIGKTNILQLAALIKKCRVYLTPDSAPIPRTGG